MADTAKRRPGRPRKNPEKQEDTPDNLPPVEGTDTESQLEMMKAQIDVLTRALSADRQVEEPEEDYASIGVIKIGGGDLSMFLTDAYGREKHFLWKKDGEVLYMTPAQYAEAMDMPGGQMFFEKLWLQLDSDELSILADPNKFIEGLELDEIHTVIEDMEEKTTLTRLINFLESSRVITEDESGVPLVDEEGFPRATVLEWTPKQRIVAQACADRLYVLTSVRYSLTDG